MDRGGTGPLAGAEGQSSSSDGFALTSPIFKIRKRSRALAPFKNRVGLMGDQATSGLQPQWGPQFTAAPGVLGLLCPV